MSMPRTAILALAAALFSLPIAARAESPAPPPAMSVPALRELVQLARERAPEVALGRSALTASRSSYASARLAPIGNPFLEVRAQGSTKDVVKDVNIDATLWLPVEIAGQKSRRGREADDYVQLHGALLEQARALAASRTVRAFGALVVGATRFRVLTELATNAQAEARYYADRMALGDATERDAALSAVDAARHQLALSETKSDLLRVEADLFELTGRRLTPDTVVETFPPGVSGTVIAQPNVERSPTFHVLSAQAKYYESARERLQSEGWAALNIGLILGRGDYGETRYGAGLGYAFPVRANQGERARADAERVRALEELALRRALFARRAVLLTSELAELGRAFEIVTHSALPAAQRAVAAATETYRSGKSDYFSVLLSQRDFSTMALRRLEILDKSWMLLGDLVEITGEVP
jgi:cobalt-zinc-cadmium efflux system outer membrane protein